ncbi:MFS transporter [Microdochium trichocladiopsis]|uniref:MFS transporter n=1 Tax=Microdochium trichocladiopsis TaxID=1682393 RepID=A0A9P9BSH5_9PEZI|nr:MFS transporter [Microdochium trichocladiopsis]KAH7033733.1 MFS transporter [Microdochium trichocladiopsis]
MTWAVLESSPRHGVPPGTGQLETVQADAAEATVVLLPAPTLSSSDPLNMPPLRKNLFFLTLVYGACVTGVIGPLLVPAFSIAAADLGVGLPEMALSNGVLIMGLGASSYICGPAAELWGRRLAFLVGPLIMLAGCIWAGFASTYSSYVGARAVQGLGMGPFFCLAGTVSINDVFFVHQRGRRVGWWNFAVLVSINITPVISGYLITALSWQWSFWILAMTIGLAVVLTFFLLPETLFDPESPALEACRTEPHAASAQYESGTSRLRQFLGLQEVCFQNPLLLFPGLIRPLGLLLSPAVLWACAMWSVTFSWVIIQGAVADQIFRAPPYSLSAGETGLLIGIPPLIGSALGTLTGGWMSDAAARFMAARNGGTYEPEYRLVVMLPTIFTMAVGTFGLGAAIQQGASIWASAVFLGITNFAVGCGCTGIITYTNDTCQARAGEAFGLAMLIKSAFAFGLSFMLNDYLARRGALVFFGTFGALTIAVTLLTVPLYVLGKQLRAKSLVSLS